MFQYLSHRSDLQAASGGWFSELPRAWGCVPLRAVVSERRGRNLGNRKQRYLSLTAKSGVIPYEEKGNVGNKKSEDLSKCKIVEIGDFVLNSMNFQIGSYGRSQRDGVCSSVYIVLRALRPAQAKYLDLLFGQNHFQRFAQMFGNGILDHRRAISWATLKNLSLPLPPAEEQAAIVKYLAHANARIDKAITTKRRLIALLDEGKRVASADVLARVRANNVERPTERLGFYIDLLTGFPFKSQYFTVTKTSRRLLRGVNVGVASIYWEDVAYLSEDAPKVDESYYLREGDIVLGMDRPLISGGVRVTEVDSASIGSLLVQRVARIRTDDRLKREYLRLLLEGSSFARYLEPIFTGISVPHLSPKQIRDFQIPVPPRSVQQEIVAEIYARVRDFERMTTRANREIELIEEFRTRLVADVVTGQVDVRRIAASLPDVDPDATPQDLANDAEPLDADEALDMMGTEARV